MTANHHGRCTTAAGGLVGWWHAGTTAPGAQGEVIRMRHGARVRVDLPRPANRFDARATERCALFEGDQVRLQPANATMDPIYTPASNVEVQGRLVTVVRAVFHALDKHHKTADRIAALRGKTAAELNNA